MLTDMYRGKEQLINERFPDFIKRFKLHQEKVLLYKKTLSSVFAFLKMKYQLEPLIPVDNKEKTILCKFFTNNFYCFTSKDYDENYLLMVFTLSKKVDLKIYYDIFNRFNLKNEQNYSLAAINIAKSDISIFMDKVLT